MRGEGGRRPGEGRYRPQFQFHLLLALPYVVTLLILCGIAGRVRAPERLGK